MLVLTRRANQRIMIGADVVVTVLEGLATLRPPPERRSRDR